MIWPVQAAVSGLMRTLGSAHEGGGENGKFPHVLRVIPACDLLEGVSYDAVRSLRCFSPS